MRGSCSPSPTPRPRCFGLCSPRSACQVIEVALTAASLPSIRHAALAYDCARAFLVSLKRAAPSAFALSFRNLAPLLDMSSSMHELERAVSHGVVQHQLPPEEEATFPQLTQAGSHTDAYLETSPSGLVLAREAEAVVGSPQRGSQSTLVSHCHGAADPEKGIKPEDAKLVTWRENDPENPRNFSHPKKLCVCALCDLRALARFADLLTLTCDVAFKSSSLPCSASRPVSRPVSSREVCPRWQSTITSARRWSRSSSAFSSSASGSGL